MYTYISYMRIITEHKYSVQRKKTAVLYCICYLTGVILVLSSHMIHMYKHSNENATYIIPRIRVYASFVSSHIHGQPQVKAQNPQSVNSDLFS